MILIVGWLFIIYFFQIYDGAARTYYYDTVSYYGVFRCKKIDKGSIHLNNVEPTARLSLYRPTLLAQRQIGR